MEARGFRCGFLFINDLGQVGREIRCVRGVHMVVYIDINSPTNVGTSQNTSDYLIWLKGGIRSQRYR